MSEGDRDERGRFKPGHSIQPPAGSVTGRPRTEDTEKLYAALSGVLDNGTLPKWRAAMKRRLERGDQWATQFVFERVAGKVPDKLEQSGPDGAPILIDIITELISDATTE